VKNQSRKTKPKRGPVHVVSRGSASVKVYRTARLHSNGRTYEQFWIAYFETGKRRRQFYSDFQEAKDGAEKVAAHLNMGEHRVLQLTSADADSYVAAIQHLKPLGVPLHAAVEDYAKARQILSGTSMFEAAEFYAQRNRASISSKSVSDVVDELLSERKREGKSERYLRSLRSHLNRFKESFLTDIGSVMTSHMEAWLSHIGGGSRTRNNLRCSLVTLFHFARKRGYLARGVTTEADEIGRNDVAASEANIYTPEQLEKLLKSADARVLPFVAIGAFCGLRSASILRLRWENVKWEQGVIEIPAAIAKNRKRYLVPLLPCLAAWLEPYRGRKGKVITGVLIEPRLRELFAAVGVERLHNGLRDSFISYRVAQTTNIPQVAYEAGNSVEMIKSKYLEARTKAEAELWFGIMPQNVEKVIRIDRAA